MKRNKVSILFLIPFVLAVMGAIQPGIYKFSDHLINDRRSLIFKGEF